MGATVEAEGGFIEETEIRGLVKYLWLVSFQCVNIIVQNGDFCSIAPFVLKYLPHPVHPLSSVTSMLFPTHALLVLQTSTSKHHKAQLLVYTIIRIFLVYRFLVNLNNEI